MATIPSQETPKPSGPALSSGRRLPYPLRDRMRGNHPRTKAAIVALGIILCATIFFYDLTHELGMSVTFLYVLVVVIASYYPFPSAPFMAGAFTSILAIIGWILPPHEEDGSQPFFRRLLSLVAIWGTAWLLWRYRTEEQRFLAMLEASEQRLNLALESGRMHTWECNPETGTMLWDVESPLASAIEFSPSPMALETFLDFVHPEDRGNLQQAISHMTQGREFLEAEFRLVLSGGQVRWIAIRGSCAKDTGTRERKFFGVWYDSTDRKDQERLLEENRRLAGERLTEIEVIYQNAPIGLCVLNCDLRFVRVNQRMAEMNGIPASDHLGRPINEIVPDLAPSVEPVFRRILETGESFLHQKITGETPAQKGKQRVFIEHWLPLKNSHDRVIGINIVAEEVTEQYLAQATLQESEATSQRRLAELQLLYDTAPIGLCFLDTDLRVAKANSALAHIMGLPPENLMGQMLRQAVPRMAEHIEPHCRQVLTHAQPVVNVEIHTTAAGHGHSERIYLASYHPVKSATGQVYGINAMFIDITDRRNAEVALKESEARFHMMGDDAPVIIWLTNAEGSLQYLNRQWYEFTGTTTEQDPDQCRLEFLHPEDRPVFAKVWETAKARPHAFHVQYRLRRQDGTYRWMADSASPRMGTQGEFLGFIGSIIDITDIKEAEEIVAKHNAALEQKVRQRTDDLIAHRDQLRKLASDLTLTEQRERRRLATDLHDYLAQMLVVCRMKIQHAIPTTADPMLSALLQQVDTVLEESLSYTRTLVAELSPQVLYESGLPEALHWLATQMVHHGLTVHVTAETPLPSIQEDQAILLYQTVRELLFNVLKHSGTNFATVSLKQVENHDLEVQVMDQGIGCDVSQLTARISHDHFGLMNIRERIEAMEGRLVLDSQPGQGTQVTAVVPLRGAQSAEAEVSSAPPYSLPDAPREQLPASSSSRITVLLVDDHAMVRDGLKNILAGHKDIQVIGEAADGMEALYLTQVHLPDMVVMDVNMPKLNGLKATKHIVKEFTSTKIIALSINDDQETISAMREAGAVAYINKGSAATQLYQTICAAYETSPQS